MKNGSDLTVKDVKNLLHILFWVAKQFQAKLQFVVGFRILVRMWQHF